MHKDNFINKILRIISIIEDSLVVICLSGILMISIFQIILRNFFDSGLIWGDSLLSVLVLWLGLAGSIVASRQGKHINIDVLSQYASEKNRLIIKKSGYLFSAFICIIISYYSFIFVREEFFLGEEAFSSIPVWVTESIIPFAFGVMSIRYILESLYCDSARYGSINNS